MIMNSDHPRWNEFLGRLAGPSEGCDFREDGPLNCKNDHRNAKNIMKSMGFDKKEIKQTCDYFLENGACCDCEILLNLTDED